MTQQGFPRCSPSISDFPTSRTLRNTFQFFRNDPACGILYSNTKQAKMIPKKKKLFHKVNELCRFYYKDLAKGKWKASGKRAGLAASRSNTYLDICFLGFVLGITHFLFKLLI